MTPLQKSIAEIEAKIAINKKQIEDAEGNKPTLLRLYSVQYGLQYAHNILTANLEYERGVIKDAYKAGIENEYGYCQRLIEQQSEQPCTRQCEHCKTYYAPLEEQLISDYYTKTYEHERKD